MVTTKPSAVMEDCAVGRLPHQLTPIHPPRCEARRCPAGNSTPSASSRQLLSVAMTVNAKEEAVA